MTVAELLARVSSRELGEWMAFYTWQAELNAPAPSGPQVNTRGL